MTRSLVRPLLFALLLTATCGGSEAKAAHEVHCDAEGFCPAGCDRTGAWTTGIPGQGMCSCPGDDPYFTHGKMEVERATAKPKKMCPCPPEPKHAKAKAEPAKPKPPDDPAYRKAWENGFAAGKREHPAGAGLGGHWISLFGLTSTPGREADVTHIEATHSPSVNIDQDRGWTADIMHGYVWANGWGVVGKVGYALSENKADVHWSVRDPGARVLRVDSDVDRVSYGVAVVRIWGK